MKAALRNVVVTIVRGASTVLAAIGIFVLLGLGSHIAWYALTFGWRLI